MRHHFSARHTIRRHSATIEIHGPEAVVVGSFVVALLRACRGGSYIRDVSAHCSTRAFVSFVPTCDVAWTRRCIASVLLDARVLIRATCRNLRTPDGGFADCANTRALKGVA